KQRRLTEYGKPKKGKRSWHQHYTKHELPNRAATADFRDKQPDKGGPGNRPPKDEQGPVPYPVAARIRLQIECTFDNVVQISARVLQESFQDEKRGAQCKNKHHKRCCKDHN